MPNFDIIRKSCPKKSFRVASVMGTYDLQSNSIEEHFGTRIGRTGQGSNGKIHNKNKKGSTSCNRITASFEFVG